MSSSSKTAAVGAETLDQLADDVRRLAVAYLQQPRTDQAELVALEGLEFAATVLGRPSRNEAIIQGTLAIVR